MSNSQMAFEIEKEEELEQAEQNPKRFKIHGGAKEFRHLEDYDMNDMCARVTVYGRKP